MRPADESSLQASSLGSGGRPKPASRWRALPWWGRGLLVFAAVVLLAAVISSFITLGDYAIVPGDAQSVVPLIGAPRTLSHQHHGTVLLTDVEIVQLRAVDYLFYRLNHDDSVEPTQQVIGTTNISTYDEQGVIDMATARQAATFAALTSLGYDVKATNAGAIVYQLEPRSVVSGRLQVGDVITAVDGHPVTSLASLHHLSAALVPGDRVTIRVHGIGRSTTRTAAAVLGVSRVQGSGSAAQLVCTPFGAATLLPAVTAGGKEQPCLGIAIEQLYATTQLPFSLNINSEGIIGPSAGLAFALGIIEKLDATDLTGGKIVAATGTIAINGAVGPVGGVAQKTVAVERAGARIFFVPAGDNYATAKQYATGGLKVYAVSSLAQAVSILEHLGGAIAPPSSS